MARSCGAVLTLRPCCGLTEQYPQVGGQAGNLAIERWVGLRLADPQEHVGALQQGIDIFRGQA